MPAAFVIRSVAQRAPLPVSPVVLSVSLHREFSISDPEDTCFLVKPDIHPSITRSFGVKFGKWKSLTAADLVSLLDALGSVPIFQVTSSGLSRRSRHDFSSLSRAPRRVLDTTGFSVYIKAAAKRRVMVRVNLGSIKVGPLTVSSRGVRLSLSSLESLTGATPLIDDTEETLIAIRSLYKNSVSVTPSPSAPGMALLRVSDLPPVLAPPKEAVERLAVLQEGYYVSCSDKVADLASAQTSPPYLDDVLYPHQQVAVGNLLSSLDRQVLALAPGAGKTATCCVLATAVLRRNDSGPAVFCVPKTLVGYWVDSLRKFAPDLSIDVPSSGSQAESILKRSSRNTAVVLTPGLLRHARSLTSVGLFVLDEAHKLIAGPATFKNVAEFSSRASKSVFVTATPDSSDSVCKRLAYLVSGAYFTSEEGSWIHGMGPYVVSAESPKLPDVRFSVLNLDPSQSDVECDLISSGNMANCRAVMESSQSASSRVLYQRAVYEDRISKATPGLLLGDGSMLGAKEEYILQASRVSTVLVAVGSVRTAKVISRRLAKITDGVVDISELDSKDRAKLASEAQTYAKVLVVPDEMMLGLNLPDIGRIIHADVPSSRSVLVQRSARSSRLDSKLESVESILLVLNGTSEQEALHTVAPDTGYFS